MRVLFSVTDKTGLDAFAKGLLEIFPNCEIVASGGTAKFLESAGIPYIPVAQVTQFPECFGGRVKTLHPAILGGILFRRGIDDEEAKQLNIAPIDLVVCNLYKDDMDIGGTTMIRAACKNCVSVGVIVDPADYKAVLEEYSKNKSLSLETRQQLARKAMLFQFENGRKLNYGENPDQEGWVYNLPGQGGIASAPTFGEKSLSYNNYEDASQAFFALQRIADGGKVAAAAVVKHGGLCGYATGQDLRQAFQMAWDADSKSAFGSIIALSQELGEEFCDLLKGRFIEVLLAPSFTPSFIEWVQKAKPALRLVQIDLHAQASHLYRGISGGMLVQTPKRDLSHKMSVATQRQPHAKQLGLFHFSLAAVQSVKSNAIVLSREYAPGFYQTIGIGGGQPNRIDSLQRLALPRAIENLEQEGRKDLSELVLASDGFFPFADSIQAAAEAGIQYFLQPGGSMRDDEVIQEADQKGLCMIFTGQRYFSH